MRFFYNLGIILIGTGIRFAALFNKKAELWAAGRKDILRQMSEVIDSQADIIWFHSASLGEFEQGRPVIEEFRLKCPGYKILLTFYSPSGYEVRKDYQGADYIFYLPDDSPANVRKFMRIVRPKIAVFVKYEFWINYLTALRGGGAKVYIISAIFRPGQQFFKWHGGLFRKALACFTHIFVQNEESRRLLKSIGITDVSVAGDTRFDRVYQIAASSKEIPAIAEFAGESEVFIAGSTWPADEQLIVRLINETSGMKFIIAPHEIDGSRIEKLIAQISGRCLRYTQLTTSSDLRGANVLFIDTIGILSSVYRYGRYAHIGGGFGTGIHNILEAATFGLPLVFGPNYGKFKEAKDLISNGGAVSISEYSQLEAWIGSLRGDSHKYRFSSEACSDYVGENKGATKQIIGEICR